MKKCLDTSKPLPPFEELFNVETMKAMKIRPEGQKLAEEIGSGKNLYIFIGSSGAGRDTVMEECLRQIKSSVRLRRTTTRKPREYIADQRRMIFITEKEFLRDFKKGEILFAGRYQANQKLYGISRKEILKLRLEDKAPHFLEENFSGLPLKIMFPKSKLVVILPPTIDVLKDRLFSRDGQDEEAEKRFAISLSEIKAVLTNLKKMIKMKLVDMVIINEGFPKEVGERAVGAIRNNQKPIEDFSRLKNSLRWRF
ncbi:MAG: hypothetical protein ACOZBZ_02055 [Patescibacteria group bacterium]